MNSTFFILIMAHNDFLSDEGDLFVFCRSNTWRSCLTKGKDESRKSEELRILACLLGSLLQSYLLFSLYLSSQGLKHTQLHPLLFFLYWDHESKEDTSSFCSQGPMVRALEEIVDKKNALHLKKIFLRNALAFWHSRWAPVYLSYIGSVFSGWGGRFAWSTFCSTEP